MATYTDRQQQILEKLGKSMGFSTSELQNVQFTADIPVNITYQNSSGTFTRNTYDQLGGILNSNEITALKSVNAQTGFAQSSSFLAAKSLLGRSLTATSSDFAQSSGRKLQSSLASINSIFNPSTARLQASGLASRVANAVTPTNVSFLNQAVEDRVRISDPTGIFINASNQVLKPLADVGYVLFPYAPSITVSHSANYDLVNLTHSNYSYPFYQNSSTASISISANFTAKDSDSAAYVVAVQHFFRSVTKMFYGKDPEAGTPPPVLRLDGYGDYQFSSVPIVILDFEVSLPTDVDYISTSFQYSPNSSTSSQGGGASTKTTKVPVIQEFSITCVPLYSRTSISQDFGLRDFAAGKLLGSANGRGGFI